MSSLHLVQRMVKKSVLRTDLESARQTLTAWSNVNSVAVESSWVRSGAGRGRFEDRVEAIVFLGVIYVMCSKQR